ncbi:DKNYY domain-containing protein [Capnocytophaga leadbetteri]|jgi:hypothetical protein|uniref:DKNYY domain-containing protein n=2 Tax=Capnocytophaga TaxID=1016 RepID=UPI0028E3D60D|nr:DKNYY domain-containing protein [Capnocytophaga leadbetteri]
MQKRLLYIITFFMMTTLQAQLPEGSYHLIACGMVGENYNTLKVQQGRVRVPFVDSCYGAIIIQKNNQILLNIGRGFDSGNNTRSDFGTYSLTLHQLNDTLYRGDNDYITLDFQLKTNDEIEIVIHRQIIHSSRYGFAWNEMIQNLPWDESLLGRKFLYHNDTKYGHLKLFLRNKEQVLKYLFAKDEKNIQELSPYEMIDMNELVRKYGISYNEYTINKVAGTVAYAKELIKEADAAIFEVLKNPYYGFTQMVNKRPDYIFSDTYTAYAKDKKNVYYQGKCIKGVTPATIKLVDPLHIKTTQQVFFENTLIANADALTFRTLNGGYARDKHRYYKEGKEISSEDNQLKEFFKTQM